MTLITPDFGIIFWQTTTFLVVLFLLSKFAWKPILAIVHTRENEVSGAIDTINQAQLLMKQLAHDRAKVIEQVHLEREHIISEALVMKHTIIEQAHQEASALKDDLLKQAKTQITREQERAFEAVKANIGGLVVEVAEKLLIKELSQEVAQLAFIERLMVSEKSSA